MAIKRNVASFSAMPDGDHKVTIIKCETVLTKPEAKEPNKPMLVVTFKNDAGQNIKSYFAKHLQFQMKALEELKKACGMSASDSHEDLLGKVCGIAVEQKANKDGQTYPTIVGFGPASDVEASPAPLAKRQPEEVKIPF